MKTTIELKGYWEQVLERAVELGIARSKTDAIRMGVMELNRNYHLIENPEAEMVVRKMRKLDEGTRLGMRKTFSEEEMLKNYPHLKNAKR